MARILFTAGGATTTVEGAAGAGAAEGSEAAAEVPLFSKPRHRR